MNIEDCPIEKGFPITLMLDATGYNCLVGSSGETIEQLYSFELRANAEPEGLILTLNGYRVNENNSRFANEDGTGAVRFSRSFTMAPGVSKDNRLELTIIEEIWTGELVKEDFVY